jgi:hypothetical protein
LLLVAAIVGGLWVVDRLQASAQQQAKAAQQAYAVAYETSAAATTDTVGPRSSHASSSTTRLV